MKLLTAVWLMTIMAACELPDMRHQRIEKEKPAIKAVLDSIIKADNIGDITTVLSQYTDDAILMPPGKPVIEGKKAIENNYRQIFETRQLVLSTAVTELRISADFAIISGRNYGSVMLKADSTSTSIDDKYMMMLLKRKGKWQIKSLIWNKNE